MNLRRPPLLLSGYFFALIGLLYLPIAVLFLFSINANSSLSFPLQGFTLDWYQKLLAADAVLRSARNSVVVAAGSSLAATLLGTMVALLFLRFQFRGKNLLLGLAVLPLIVPFIVLAVALLLLFSALHVEKSEPTARYRRLTLRRALLLYRFKRPTAAIARTVFWFWTALTILLAMTIVLSVFDDPRLIPANLAALVAFAGWAIGLRYWAVSLNERTASTTAAASPGG